jgi:hypothetical protein
MDVNAYLSVKFFSRDAAEAAMHDFSILKRRLRKWHRGTNDAHSIFNIIWGLENTFEPDFVDHILTTRFSLEERRIYGSCLRAKGERRMKEYNHEFSIHLERDLWRIRHG